MSEKTVISSHWDADAISSVVCLMKGLNLTFDNTEILINKEAGFGVVDRRIDYMLDMHPVDDNMTGIVYDHHESPPYPPPQERAYKLIYDEVPTSLIVWRNHRKTIPKSEHWKCVTSDTKILTTNGPKRIDKITINDIIISVDLSKQQLIKTIPIITNNGKNKILIIKTKNGRTIKCTLDHKLYISNNSISIINAKNLKIGDKLVIINE